MTVDEVRARLRSQPFRPFGLRLPDGDVVRVNHSEFALLSPSGRTLHVYQTTDESSLRILDLDLVSAIEPLEASSKNGRRRRRAG